MRKRVLIDMDGVMANTSGPWYQAIRDEYNIEVDCEKIKSWNLHTELNLPDTIYRIIERPGFFENLPVMDNAVPVAEALWKYYDCYIVSAASYTHDNATQKWRWLQKHFPFIKKEKVIFAKDKSVIKADFMIDDGPHNLKGFDGWRICFDHPYNRVLDFPIDLRVSNWYEVANFFNLELE
jgi:5'-nucleotidase